MTSGRPRIGTILDQHIRSGVVDHRLRAVEIHHKISMFWGYFCETTQTDEPMPSYRTIARRVKEIKAELSGVNSKK